MLIFALFTISIICSQHSDHTYARPSTPSKAKKREHSDTSPPHRPPSPKFSEKHSEIAFSTIKFHRFFPIFIETFSYLPRLKQFLHDHAHKEFHEKEIHSNIYTFNKVLGDVALHGVKGLASTEAVLVDELITSKPQDSASLGMDEISVAQYVMTFASLISRAEANLKVDRSLFQSKYTLWRAEGDNYYQLKNAASLLDIWSVSPSSDFSLMIPTIFNSVRDDFNFPLSNNHQKHAIECPSLPYYLIITVGRLRADLANREWIKVSESFPFPRSFTFITSEITCTSSEYTLKAVIYQIGRDVTGNYEAYVYHKDDWIRLSNGERSSVEKSQVFRNNSPRDLRNTAVLLIYELSECVGPSPKKRQARI